ncbi:MAG: sigma-70 family RNA polymerase sigma factor [Candidatus Kapaibacterium sp.]
MSKSQRNVAIDTTVRKERRRLLDFIRLRVGTEEDAEDILQDVFYQLVTSYSVTEPIERLASWLFTVARNKIIDRYRKRKPEPAATQIDARDDDESELSGIEDLLFDPADTPDMVYARSLVWSELAVALEELPEAQRDVFVMHELEGRSFKEIAEITGDQIPTLLSRKRYAVIYLRERLQELYDEMRDV